MNYVEDWRSKLHFKVKGHSAEAPLLTIPELPPAGATWRMYFQWMYPLRSPTLLCTTSSGLTLWTNPARKPENSRSAQQALAAGKTSQVTFWLHSWHQASTWAWNSDSWIKIQWLKTWLNEFHWKEWQTCCWHVAAGTVSAALSWKVDGQSCATVSATAAELLQSFAWAGRRLCKMFAWLDPEQFSNAVLSEMCLLSSTLTCWVMAADDAACYFHACSSLNLIRKFADWHAKHLSLSLILTGMCSSDFEFWFWNAGTECNLAKTTSFQ